MMKYLKNYDSWKVNEELLGSVFKGLKNKISLGFSKMFGNAAKADKVIEEYKKEILKALSEKHQSIKAYSEYVKLIIDGGEKDDNKLKQLSTNIDTAASKFDERMKLIKQKFDIKFQEIIDEEKNKKIQNYIMLKKIEIQQDILAGELKMLLGDGEMDEKELAQNKKMQDLVKDIKDKSNKLANLQKEEKNKLEEAKQLVITFDLKLAKKMAEEGKVYLWEKSPMKDYKFLDGDNIVFFSTSNKLETNAEVVQDIGKRIRVKTENGNTIEINKLSVISSENFDKK